MFDGGKGSHFVVSGPGVSVRVAFEVLGSIPVVPHLAPFHADVYGPVLVLRRAPAISSVKSLTQNRTW